MQTNLEGKVAFVTGSSKGIGKAIALKLAQNGADVAINARHPQSAIPVQEQIQELKRRCLFERGDICAYDDMKRAVDDILSQWGRLDILVASGSPGDPPPGLFHEIPPERYLEYFQTRLVSRLYPLRAALDPMKNKGQGKIIIITTDAGRIPTPGESLIGAPAAGLVLMTKVLAREFSRWKIHINTICVSVVMDTPGYDKALQSGMGKIFQRAAERMPFYPVLPDDVAEMALFLASQDSDRITGQIFSINGGLSFPG
jgi:2-hydroxycyclohexanecarboxyl-CoA dehydrogenase